MLNTTKYRKIILESHTVKFIINLISSQIQKCFYCILFKPYPMYKTISISDISYIEIPDCIETILFRNFGLNKEQTNRGNTEKASDKMIKIKLHT